MSNHVTIYNNQYSTAGFSVQDTLVAMQALKALANKNQDRVNYHMTFTFKSDQVANWTHTIHINQQNWFELQRFQVISFQLV